MRDKLSLKHEEKDNLSIYQKCRRGITLDRSIRSSVSQIRHGDRPALP
jgi:hypothetical protein